MAQLLANPDAAYYAILVSVILGISIGVLIVIGVLPMLIDWLYRMFSYQKPKVAMAILISICIGIAAEVVGYVAGNRALYIAGTILFFIPLLVGLVRYNKSKG